MAESDGLQIEIGVTEKRYLQQLAKLEAQTLRAAKKTETSWKRSNQRVSRSFQKVDRAASGFARGGLRNVSLQLSQVAQQASVTGDPLRALAIQLPDLALGFGTLGIAIGAVAGALGPLVIELLTADGEVKDLDKTVDGLATSVDRYRDAALKAASPSADLKDEYGDLADEARALYEAQAKLEKLDALANLRDAQVAIADRFGSLAGVTEDYALAYGAALDRIAELNNPATNEQGISLISDEQLAANIREIDALQSIVSAVRPAIARVKEDLNLTDEAAGQFLASLVRLRDASPGAEMQQALAQVRDHLFQSVDGGAQLTGEMETLIRSVLGAEKGMLVFVDAERDAEAAAKDVSTAIAGIDLSGQISQAELFAVALGGAADQAARALQLLQLAQRSDFTKKLDRTNPDFFDPRGGVDAPGSGHIPPEILPKLPAAPNTSVSSRGGGGGGSGGSGGGSSAALMEMTAAAREALQILQEVNRESVTYSDVMAELSQMLDAGKISQDQFNESADKAEEKLKDLSGGANRLSEDLGQMFASAVDGAESLSDALENVLSQLSSMLINDAFSSLFGGGGSIFASLFGNANGNAFANGRVVPFASGGIVSKPTVFPMRGATGLMGEAGPEAIMPLTRVGGKLGVRAQGGGALQLTYAPVIDARGADPSVLERIEKQQHRMAAEFETRVHGVLRTGRNTRRNMIWGG